MCGLLTFRLTFGREGLRADAMPLSSMQTPPPLPPSPSSLPQSAAPATGGVFTDFIEGFKGLPGRIKDNPKPQPLKWYDRFPVVFGSLFLFWPVGVLCVWLTKRFQQGDKARLTACGLVWGMVLGAFSPSEDQRNGPSPNTPGKASSSSRVAQGQTFRLGDFSYTIGQCYYKHEIGQRGFETLPSNGAFFLVVRYTIQNESRETQTVASDDFTLRDAKGREFSPSSKALTALMMSGANKDFILSELQPGLEHQTMTAFEVPESATHGGLFLIVPQKGLFSSGKREVVLSNIDNR